MKLFYPIGEKGNAHGISLILILLIVFLAGCATNFEDLLRAEYEGKVRSYPVDEEQAWMIVRRVFLWEGARDEEIAETKAEKTLSWEGVMWARIEPVDEARTRVTVKKATIPCSPTSPILTEEEFHARFVQAVNILKTGRSLPKELPSK
jgi:hypothetical protein